MDYKYILEPYKSGGSNRYTCPHCGKYKCFTRFVNVETGEYVNQSCGKCDHENSCGYLYTPKDYFRDHPDSNQHPTAVPPSKPSPIRRIKEQPTPTPLCVIDPLYVERSHSKASQFMCWLGTLGSQQDIERVYETFRLGATRDGGVIFWQIDTQDRVRTGKVMHYRPDGHRVKDAEDYARMLCVPDTGKGNFPTYFIHSKMKSQGLLPLEWKLSQCLFGIHQLSTRPYDTVCIVESEKSAVVCSIFYPQFLWLATGGGNGLSPAKLHVLKGRRVIIYPDSGELEAWRKVMEQTEGFSYTIVKDLESYIPNTDIADIILGEAREKEDVMPAEQIATPAAPTTCEDAMPQKGADTMPSHDEVHKPSSNDCHEHMGYVEHTSSFAVHKPSSNDCHQHSPAEQVWQSLKQAYQPLLELEQQFDLVMQPPTESCPF